MDDTIVVPIRANPFVLFERDIVALRRIPAQPFVIRLDPMTEEPLSGR